MSRNRQYRLGMQLSGRALLNMKEIKTFLATNENGATRYQNICESRTKGEIYQNPH
jgi:hypothetical protein